MSPPPDPLQVARVTKLRAFAEARPQDPFPRYALALEHRNAGAHAEALSAFQELITAHPDYVPAYLHAGNASIAVGEREGARELWQRGLEAARKKGDSHAAGELEGALGSL